MGITFLDLDAFRSGTRTVRLAKHPEGSTNAPPGDVIQWFLDFYWVRHPMSRETLAAYRVDLLTLERWLSVFHSKTLVAASTRELREFLDRQRSPGSATSDLPSLSCIKRFYFYLMQSGLRTDDPTERLYVRTPRLVNHNLSVIPGKKN